MIDSTCSGFSFASLGPRFFGGPAMASAGTGVGVGAGEEGRDQSGLGAVALDQAAGLAAALDQQQGGDAGHAEVRVEAIGVPRLVLPVAALADWTFVQHEVRAQGGAGA